MTFKAIIFDLDGTLLNTLNDIANSVNRVLTRQGFPVHAPEAYRYFIGDGSMTLIERSLPEDQRSITLTRKCHEAFIQDYGNNWNVETSIYTGIAPMLDLLCRQNIRLSVLSNKPHEFTVKCVHEFLHQWSFEPVFGYQEKIPKKPDPTGAFMIARLMEIDPSDFIYLGDSSVDMKTAAGAGMFAVGALWGFREKGELIEAGANLLLNNPQELLSHLPA